ncbi:class I SAM-dependent DNA methyltransferase [Hymenobacter koreensis]|uniref:site-specific DNA-methyltransferase (adenine-specific) n=2 Tax=Hymenobacter koreensis TaxID=1084523 RepID=A0ABP8IY26_9BACT
MRRLEYVDNGDYFIEREDLKWSKFRDLPPEELLEHIRANVFPFIKNLHDPHEPFSMAMDNAVFLIDKPTLLKEAIEVIDEIYKDIDSQKDAGQHFQDTPGDLYEHLLKATSEAGKNGQFRTPRHIIQMMCEIADPDVGDRICDVTCGTGGFLVGAYQHILSKYSSSKYIEEDENGLKRSLKGDLLSIQQFVELKSNTFFGFDIDPTMIRIGLMNMIMHGITEPRITRVDTLSEAFDVSQSVANASTPVAVAPPFLYTTPDLSDEQYSIILANPPFTGRIDKSTLSKKLQKVDTSQSELLFLHRIIRMLKTNGRAAVIIPEGVLFGTSNAQKYTRETLLKDCCLNAVISMPSGVFYPYTGVKTSIIVFTKKELGSTVYHTDKVWFYGMDGDGYSLDTNRKKLKENPLPIVSRSYKTRESSIIQDRKGKYFYVPIDEIQKQSLNLSFNQYKEFVYEAQEHEPPGELLARIIELEKSILNDLTNLSTLL